MSTPLRVGLYLRVSTDEQTVENQRLDLMRVAEQRGWHIVAEYVDAGISGAKGRDERPEFARLCRDASGGKLDMVAAWALDRVGRSLGHLVTFLEELRAWRVGLYLHKQQVDTTTATGRAFLHMAALFSEFERDTLLERIHAGIARARIHGTKSGKPIGRPPVPAVIRRRIRALRSQGRGKLAIARELHCGVGTVQRVLATTA